MNNKILAKNLLIQKQIEDIAVELSKNGVTAVLLKGAALVLSFPSYTKLRNMEDIDLLVKPETLRKAREILISLGYDPFPEDPCALRNPSLTAPVDITDNIWYLDRNENNILFNESLKFCHDGFSGCMFHLKPEDFYIHVLAHGALHHAEDNKAWKDDLSLIWDNWGKTIDWKEVAGKLKAYGFEKAANAYLYPETAKNSFYLRILRSKNNPLKGHFTRFIYLPFTKKFNYVFSALFPSKEFLLNRYELKNSARVFFYRVLRPFLLLKNLALFAKRLLF